MKTIYAGTRVRISCVLSPLTSPDVPADPASVTCEVTSPSGVVNVTHWPADPEIVHESAGKFHLDVEASSAGVWKYRWSSIGGVQAVSRGEFKVLA